MKIEPAVNETGYGNTLRASAAWRIEEWLKVMAP